MALDGFQIGEAVAQSAPDDSLRLGPIRLLGTEPSYLDLSAGAEDIAGTDDKHQMFGGGVEYQFGQKLFYLGPALGVIANERGGGMVYAALYADVALGPVILTPLGGVGAWWRNGHEDDDLGGTFEFRMALTAAYQFADLSRLGVRFGHISNAGINDRNPGENDLMLTYGFPLRF